MADGERPSSLLPSTAAAPEDDARLQRLQAVDTLVPGYYWRARRTIEAEGSRYGLPRQLLEGDVHLLLDIFEFEGAPHSATLQCHPRDGDEGGYTLLIRDFLDAFEPAPDGAQVRQREIAEIMARAQAIQQQIVDAEANPLLLPGVQEAAAQAVEKFERELLAEELREQKKDAERQKDIRKLHRRAARRAAAAGNPLAVRSATISDRVDVMIAGGLDPQGLRDMSVEGRRRQAIMQASADFMAAQAERLKDTVGAVAAYYAEPAKVALAKAGNTLKNVRATLDGLASLKLYTGTGVTVVTIAQGASAAPDVPLTLVQGKRYMDEELSVWADVEESFDWRSREAFFEAMAAQPGLVDQVFPSARCVVSAATTRRDIRYGEGVGQLEAVLNAIENKRVCLLVRDGGNLHVVYSAEPSHERTERLFPTRAEIEGHFTGIDGSRIGLQDLAFGKASARFEQSSLHYLRFLVLLCGLDHRSKLFGEFYPPGLGLSFMKLEFQQRYFRFLADEERERLLGEDLPPLREWLAARNKALRSGSRVVLSQDELALRECSPLLERRRYSVAVDWAQLPPQLVAQRQDGQHCLLLPTVVDRQEPGTATVWLDGPQAKSAADWFLCLDQVRLQDVRRYLYSRTSRVADISWLRVFKRAEATLAADLAAQEPLRAYLRATALEHRVLQADAADAAIDAAICTWRASHRGAPAPLLDDTKGVQELLTLLYPVDRLAGTLDALVDEYVQREGLTPLRLARTGKTRLALYVQPGEADRAPYGSAVAFGWVKRLVVEARKSRLVVTSSSLVWLQSDKPRSDEQELRSWPALAAWVHEGGEPCSLADLALAHQAIADSDSWRAVLEGNPDQPALDDTRFAEILDGVSRLRERTYYACPYVVVPIGVVQFAAEPSRQPAQHGEVRFFYAAMPAAAFVSRYGSPQQVKALRRSALSRFPHMQGEIWRQRHHWTIVACDAPLRRAVAFVNNDRAGWVRVDQLRVETHERGGYRRRERSGYVEFNLAPSTRAERRAAGGQPAHKRLTVNLSFNRALDALVGTAPHLRRAWYRRAWPWRRSTPDKWCAPQATYEFSALVWDDARGRGVADRLFRRKASRLDAEAALAPLEAFQQEHGHCRLLPEHEDELECARRLRRLAKYGKLAPEAMTRLQALRFGPPEPASKTDTPTLARPRQH